MQKQDKVITYDYSDETINELIALAKDDDEFAYNELFKIFEPLIKSIAKQYIQYENYDDLIQNGLMGIVHAIRKFDFQKNIKFSTFAFWEIKGEMLKGLNTNSKFYVSQGFKKFALTVLKISSEIELKTNHFPTDEEILEALNDDNITPYEVFLARNLMQSTISIDTVPVSNDDQTTDAEMTLAEQVFDSPSELDNSNSKLLKYIHNSKLDDREIYIVSEKLGLNSTHQKKSTHTIGTELHISDSRVMQLYRRAIIKIKKHAAADGYNVKKR